MFTAADGWKSAFWGDCLALPLSVDGLKCVIGGKDGPVYLSIIFGRSPSLRIVVI